MKNEILTRLLASIVLGALIMALVIYKPSFNKPKHSTRPVGNKQATAKPKKEVDWSKPETVLSLYDMSPPEEVRELCNKFISKYPNSHLIPRAKYMIGISYYRECDYSRAIEEFEDIVRLYPNSVEAGYGFAKYALEAVFSRVGNWPTCPNEKIREFILRNPAHKMAPDAQYALAYRYHSSTIPDNYSLARQEFQILISSFPGNKYENKAKKYIDWVGRIEAQANIVDSSGLNMFPEAKFILGKHYYDFLHDFPIDGEVGIYLEPAFAIFREIIDKYPASKNADEAFYLMLMDMPGRAFEGGDTSGAWILAEKFQEFVDKYPQSNHTPEVMFKIAEFLDMFITEPMSATTNVVAAFYGQFSYSAWQLGRTPKFGLTPQEYIDTVISKYSEILRLFPGKEYEGKARERIAALKEKRQHLADDAITAAKDECFGTIMRCEGSVAICCGRTILVGPNVEQLKVAENMSVTLTGIKFNTQKPYAGYLYVVGVSTK